MERLFKKVGRFAEETGAVKSGDTVLLAVSGGPDSVFLLHFFGYLAKKKDIRARVAYIHHHLRKEADEEAVFVKALAAAYSFPFYCRDIKLGGKAAIEEEGRAKRYRALYDAARESGCCRISTGHTLDDQAETLLMHLVKGAGLAGLRGMLPVSDFFKDPGILLIRPMLCIGKPAILEALKKSGKEYRTDSYNLSGDFFRNRIRRDAMPLLKTYNPNIARQLARTALLLQDDFRFLQDNGREALKKMSEGRKGGIDTGVYGKLDISVKRMAISLMVEKLTGNPYRSFDRIEKIRRRLDKEVSGYIGRDELEDIIRDRPVRCEIEGETEEISMEVPGVLRLADGRTVKSATVNACLPLSSGNDRFTCCLDQGKTGSLLTVRGYKKGDFFQPLGMEKRTKLSRFLTGRKIPSRRRGDLLVFLSGGEIAWVCGAEISERFKVDRGTKKVLKISVSG